MFIPLRAAAAGLLLLTVLSACAGAADPNGVASLQTQGTGADASPAPSASLDPEAAQLAFAKCMREHGVDMPDPGSGGSGGVSIGDDSGKLKPEEMQAAMDACDQFLQAAGNFKQEIDPAQLDKMIEFAGCMRDHGVDMPDPNVNGNGGMVFRSANGPDSSGGPSTKNEFSGGVDPTSPVFKAAEEACRSILGDAGLGGPQFQTGGGPDKP
jgi:hypothetical protein